MLRFHTRSGVLTATRDGDLIELDFPAKREEPIAAPAGLLDALGVDNATYVGRNQFDYIVELPSEDEVRALKPDHARAAPTAGARRHRHQPRVDRRLRLRLPLLRARLRRRRRSGHRLLALLPHALLGRSASARTR